MTSISAVGQADAGAAPKAKSRNLSLDRARTFLTLVVLLHHAVIPYTYFGHTDPKYFFGFDMIVLATDSFFMAMFFFLSGLFVWPGIARKGPANYMADRLLRLGLPVRDLRVHGHSARLLRDLAATPSRNRLFGILVEYDHERPVAKRADLVSLGSARLRPGCLPAVPAVAQPARSDQSPLAARSPPARRVLRGHAGRHRCVLRSRAGFTLAPSNWFEFGPFSVQHGRVMLYATYFFFGAGIGVAQMDRGLLAADGRMAKVSWDWMVLAIVPYCLLWVLIFIKREILGNPSPLPDWYEALYAICFTVFSVAILFLILAYFLRFRQSGSAKLLDPMQADAYGMFLVHYPIALWLQYWLFDYDLPAIVKATDRVRADGRVQLGTDARVAADSGRDKGALGIVNRHCERSEAIHLAAYGKMDCSHGECVCQG